MEKDNEIKGIGNSLDFGARMYDSRLGRWLSQDPKTSIGVSTYAIFGNKPILYSDILLDTIKLSGSVGLSMNFGSHNNSLSLKFLLTQQFGPQAFQFVVLQLILVHLKIQVVRG